MKIKSEGRSPSSGVEGTRKILESIWTSSKIQVERDHSGDAVAIRIEGAQGEELFLVERVSSKESGEKLDRYAEEIAAAKAKGFADMSGGVESPTPTQEDIQATKDAILAGESCVILLRLEGNVIGYIEFELMGMGQNKTGREEAFFLDWMVWVDPTYRSKGVARALYALSLEMALSQAQVEKKDLVAIVAATGVRDAHIFTRAIGPTFPYIVGEKGQHIEIIEPRTPAGAGEYSGTAESELRYMIRFTYGAQDARPVDDVRRILHALSVDAAKGVNGGMRVAIEKTQRFLETLLAYSAGGVIHLLTPAEENEERDGGTLLEGEAAREWVRGEPSLELMYADAAAAAAAHKPSEGKAAK